MTANDEVSDRYGRVLLFVDKQLSRFENVLNFVAGALIFGLMFLGVVQIVLRTVFKSPIFGYIDIVEVSMVGFAVLSIAFVQRVGGHVRMELIVQRLSGRALWLVELISTAVAAFIVGVLIPYSYDHFYRAMEFGDSTIDIELVTWPAKLIVPFALSVLLVRLAVQLAGYCRLVMNPSADPLAVPQVKDAAAHARDEISLTAGQGRS